VRPAKFVGAEPRPGNNGGLTAITWPVIGDCSLEDHIGKELGPYEAQALISTGGMADVYQGYQPGVDRIVIIKIDLPQFL
jgi:hypothetical protein